MFLRSLKLEISLLETVGIAFCSEMSVFSFTASSISFLSATAPFTPWFKQILTRRGHCLIVLYLNFFIKAGTASSLYFFCKRGRYVIVVAIILFLLRIF